MAQAHFENLPAFGKQLVAQLIDPESCGNRKAAHIKIQMPLKIVELTHMNTEDRRTFIEELIGLQKYDEMKDATVEFRHFCVAIIMIFGRG